jgi:MFS family permease
VILPTGPICFFIPLLIDTCAGLIRMAGPVLLKGAYGLPDSQVGLVIGTSTVLYTVLTLWGGILADRWGTLNGVKVGLLLIGLNAVAFCLLDSKIAFILCTITVPTGHAFFWPAFQAWIGTDVDRLETARRLGIFSIGFSLGLCAVGPYVAGFALEQGPKFPFYLAAFLSLSTLVFFHFANPDLLRHEIHATGQADEFVSKKERRRFLTMARIGILGAVAAMTILQTFIPLVGLDWKLSESVLGKLVAVLGITMSSTFVAMVLTQRWHYRASYLLGAQAVGAFGLLILGGIGSVYLLGGGGDVARLGIGLSLPALGLSGIMCGVCYFSSSFYAIFGEEEKGKNSGIHEAIIGVANVVAQYGGGASVYLISKMAPYWLSGLFVLILMVLQWRVYRSGRGNGE